MIPDKISFVDIETTGTSSIYDRIIEIGIIKTEGGKIVKKYNSLINPGLRLNPFIKTFTGITDEELENAPSFYEIKDGILEIIKDSVFAAHNVHFDYGFLKNEYKRYEQKFCAKIFCTVKLARYLYPGFRNYNLDSIIERFDIKCKRRHRAMDDAKVLWDFYSSSKKQVEPERFEKAVAKALKHPSLPVGISFSVLDSLPNTCGVYVFYGETQVPLYIGKSINIRDRVLSHFSNSHLSQTDLSLAEEAKNIETIPTAGELGALFLESTLIKKHQPLYNRKLRYARKLIAIKKLQNTKGYNTIDKQIFYGIEINDMENILAIFKSEKQLKDSLYSLAKEYNLCPKLLNLQKCTTACFYYHLKLCQGACIGGESAIKYNMRFNAAFTKYKIKTWPFPGPVIIRESQELEENFLIDRWCFLGTIKDESDLYENIENEYLFDYDTYIILKRFLSDPKNLKKVKLLNNHHKNYAG